MKGNDSVVPDRLEESLSCDDLFLEYFNSFLELSAFPLRIRYDRLTGTFHEVNKNEEFGHEISQKTKSKMIDISLTGNVHGLFGGPPYGVRDDEKERVLQWAHQNRLPLFLQTRLYREFKLCKLLLRPLDFRRGSSRIRGYSRLSMGTTATSFTPIESPLPDTQSIAWTDGQSIKKVSYGLNAMDRSRPNSRALSLPPDLGGRTWSATAMYDTSATETSSSTANEVAAWQRRNEKHQRSRRRYPGGKSDQENIDTRISDSGLGTTAFDYSTTIGTSGKTRNIGTRADTLGVGSRWESEAGYSTRTPDTRTQTAMTYSSLPADGFRSAVSTSAHKSGHQYEGKSALRTSDSPSKPHRATIILPRTGKNSDVVISDTPMRFKPTGDQYSVDDASDFVIHDEDDDMEEVDDDEDGGGSGFLEFDDRDSSCDETETEIESIQKVHSMKLQHIKERLLGSKEGVDSLLNFLSDTAGIYLILFWLDAEAFKDAFDHTNNSRKDLNDMDDGSDSSNISSVVTDDGVMLAWRHRLFREILDRHKFTLSEEATEQIREAQSNVGLTCHVFARTQYDALRRLRSYWLPRYIVHCSTRADFEKRLSTGTWDVDCSSRNSSTFRYTFLPLLTIGHLVPNSHLNYENSSFRDGENIAVRPLESVNQENAAMLDRPTTAQIRVMSAKSAYHHFLLRALASEADAGCPFRRYIIESKEATARNAYDFWVTLEHFASQKSREGENKLTRAMAVLKSSSSAADFPLEVIEAWKMFSNFVWPIDAPRSLTLPENMHSYARSLENLLSRALTEENDTRSNITSSVFRPAKLHALYILSECWKKYCKHENRDFFEAREGRPYSSSGDDRSVTPPRASSPKIKKQTKQFDEMSTTLSETTTIFSKPWLTDDDTTETDSASTMYSYDVERIRQIASIIRKRGAKKPQRTPHKKPPPIRRRIGTAVKSTKVSEQHKATKEHDVESVSSKTSKKKQTKVQFSLPDKADSSSPSRVNGEKGNQEEGEVGDDEGDGEEDKNKRKKKKSLLHRHPNRMNYQEIKENKLHMYFRKYVAQCESMEVQNVFQMYALCEALRSVPMTEVDRRSALANEISRTYLSSSGPKQIAMSSEFLSPFMNELPNPSMEATEALQLYVVPTLNQAAANFSIGFSAALKEYKLDIRSDLVQNSTKAELALRTLTLKPSSKRRRALGKHSARQPPNTDHKQTFMDALQRAAEGDLPLDLLHFYKYLQGFGSQEGFPLIHNDLLFYVEVSKFLACFHETYDLVTLKRKIQSILGCFITSAMEPTLQIDIKTGTAERLRRAADSFVNDKGRQPHTSTLFDDAQHTVFNELLPFWAGFASARPLAERDEKRPVLKSERLHKRRLEAFMKTPDPKTVFNIPKSVPKFDMHGLEFTFSVNGGIQWKEWSEVSSSRSSSPPPEGIIEVVKMPPRSQARRMIRRGNFSVKKLNAIQEKSNMENDAWNSKKTDGKGNVNLKKTVSIKGANKLQTINYTTSVS
uniref:uncharacterized protein LOC120331161 n=1 Tax=Styela clava TaxID=7725 RepID=UPI00193A79DE|nr:uncharacterized protein LOC120331161 [Styela clava]